MAARSNLSNRFTSLLESGMSKEEAWKIMAVEILADSGLTQPKESRLVSVQPGPVESGLVPIYESKLIKVIRIDPLEDDRIRVLLGRAKQEAAASKTDTPTESSIIRQAMRLGLDELQRRNARR